MSDSPHFSETNDVEINLDALTPDTAEEKDDEVEIDLGDLSEEDSAEAVSYTHLTLPTIYSV